MPTPLFPEETELQSAAFADSLFSHLSQDWSWRTESNHQPADYKSAALPLSHASIFFLRRLLFYHIISLLSISFLIFFKIFLFFFLKAQSCCVYNLALLQNFANTLLLLTGDMEQSPSVTDCKMMRCEEHLCHSHSMTPVPMAVFSFLFLQIT